VLKGIEHKNGKGKMSDGETMEGSGKTTMEEYNISYGEM
jgi:hypothetical protein